MKKILPLAIYFILVSCDPVVTFNKVIQNDSSQDIWLIKNDTAASPLFFKDSVLVSSKESFVIDEFSDIAGSLASFESCPLYPFPSDTLFTRIKNNSNLKLKTNITENSAWQYKVIEPGNSGLAECRLIITDDDIE